jgi:predicted DNA-binding transcriptional regulator AlpA
MKKGDEVTKTKENVVLNPNLTLIDVPELSKRLNVKRSWIYTKTRETGPDAIPRIKVGKYLRFDLNDVLRWLDKQYGDTNEDEDFKENWI